jgi:TPR repeat protein
MTKRPPVSINAGMAVPGIARRRCALAALVGRRSLGAVLLVVLFGATAMQIAYADTLALRTAAYSKSDDIRAVRKLSPPARRGNARALARLGFMYEHGLGEPQAYEAAADLYTRAAVQGNPFAQGMLGLMYDKGHGVPQDFVLAYKWLDLAAARAHGRERDAYARLRDAVASKMSSDQIVEGQRLVLNWTPGVFAPSIRVPHGVLHSAYHPE